MSLFLLFAMGVASFATAIISATVGMAGGIVLLSFMTFFMELSVIVPIHGVVQLASNATRVSQLLKYVEPKILVPKLIGLPLGTLAAVYLIKSVDNPEVFYLLVAALIFYVLFKPKNLPKLHIPFWSFGILGFVVGLMGPLIGATGPLMAPFYLRDDLTKEKIVATKSAAQTVGHLLKLPAFIYLGFDYLNYTILIAVMVAGVALGTMYGVMLLRSMNEKTFRLIYRTALLVAATRIVYKAIFL